MKNTPDCLHGEGQNTENLRDPMSEIPSVYLQKIQEGTLKYEWKGILCCKNPFDFALYSMLIWREKPGTIFEIGTYFGGGALWLADLTRCFGLNTQIISVDIEKFDAFSDARIDFRQGDAHKLASVFSREELSNFPRPWLVIEDSSHMRITTRSVLEFFHDWLNDGEYILIEDGIMDSFNFQDRYDGGPNQGVVEFLETRPGEYEVDANFCDYFGYNVTWNTNGYLRRVRKDE